MPTGFFTHDLCHSYQQGPDSPESPERIDAIEDRMLAMGLSRVVTVLPSAPASLEDVLRAHDKSYVQELEQTSREAQRTGEKQISEDTFINELSFEAALKSAGAAIEAVRQVCAGTIRNAFACVRPPGHHAGRNFAHGFCLISASRPRRSRPKARCHCGFRCASRRRNGRHYQGRRAHRAFQSLSGNGVSIRIAAGSSEQHHQRSDAGRQ